MKENKFFKKFISLFGQKKIEVHFDVEDVDDVEADKDVEDDEDKFTNATILVIEKIKTFHQIIESDEGISEDRLLAVEFKHNPEDALDKYIALAEFSEKQYKKYGGTLYTSNYAVRLEKVAESYLNMEHFEDAIDWYYKASNVFETLIKIDRYKDYESQSRCYENAGLAALRCETYERAEALFALVLDLRLKTKNKFPDVFNINDLAVSNYNLALSQYKLNNYDLAIKYFKIAADSGDAQALNYLGIIYEEELGLESDIEKAKEYYKKAFEQSDENGKINLER